MRSSELSCCRLLSALLLVVMSLIGYVQAMQRGRLTMQARSKFPIRPPLRLFATLDATEKKWASPLASAPPLNVPNSPTVIKTMVFLDGTWLYYSLVQGRSEKNCPIERKFGSKWSKTHRVEWSKLPQLLAANLRNQLDNQKILSPPGVIDITRTSVFTSLRADTETGSARETMLSNFYKNNFDVHRFETKALQEKCVDIALAVEMLYMATIPGAFDLAVIVTGDKDFMPALEKTRLLGKRVAICSMRNGCNGDLVRIENRIRDFDMIWLDDYLDELIVPKRNAQDKLEAAETNALVKMMIQILQRPGCAAYSSRDMGRELQTARIGHQDALSVLKTRFGSLRTFCERLPQVFTTVAENEGVAFAISLSPQYLTYQSQLSDSSSSSSSGSDSEDSEGTDSDSSDSEGEGSSSSRSPAIHSYLHQQLYQQNHQHHQLQHEVSYAELLDRDNFEPAQAECIGKTLVGIVRQVFVNERTDVLNSRTLGRLVQGFKSVEGYNNALSALKAAYVNVFGFFEAHPAVFSIEEEPEVGLGGFRVRLLQAAPPGVSAGSEKADNDLGEQEATAGAIVVADFSNSRSAATTTAGTQTAQWHSQADAVASKSSSSTSLSSVAASVAAAAIGRKTSAERHIVVSPDSAEQTPRQNRKKLVKYLSTLKVPELKVLLKAAKLPLTGSKVALIERLVEAENLQI